MPVLIALVLVAVLAVVILTIAVHLLFSPWLLLLAAVAVVAWVKLRPRQSRQSRQ
jgi:chromate transport protein ChrA